MATILNSLQVPEAPNLPLAPATYDPRYIDQLTNVLRLYFNRLGGNAVHSVLGPGGGQHLNAVYGAFSSQTTQTVAGAATPRQVTFDSTDYAQGVTLLNPYTEVVGDSIYVDQPGIYNVQFSCQLTNDDNQIHDMDIWLRKGVDTDPAEDIDNTASVVSVQGTHGGLPGYHIIAANFFVEIRANEYIELWWAASSTQLKMNYLPAITSPFASPGAPSIVVTVTFVSTVTTA